MASTLPRRAGQVVIPSGAHVHFGDVQQRDRACPVARSSSRCMRACPTGFMLDRRLRNADVVADPAGKTAATRTAPRGDQHVRAPELVMVGEMPVERSAHLILLLYLGKRGRPKVRIHGRPRSDRKKRFLLSAVAPSTVTRHPRKAKPINWAQRGGLASGGKLPSDAEATFHRAIMHAW
jgi:hypothetical protein